MSFVAEFGVMAVQFLLFFNRKALLCQPRRGFCFAKFTQSLDLGCTRDWLAAVPSPHPTTLQSQDQASISKIKKTGMEKNGLRLHVGEGYFLCVKPMFLT